MKSDPKDCFYCQNNETLQVMKTVMLLWQMWCG